MKFVYPEIHFVIETNSDKVNTLIIENQKLFCHILADISGQLAGNDGKAVVSENGKILPFGKKVELISQVVPFSINQKNLVNKLISELERRTVDETEYEKTIGLVAEIEQFLMEVSFQLVGDIRFTKLSIGSIIKAVGPEFEEEYDSLGEKLIDYMELVREYDRPKLFIFINLRSFMTDAETAAFLKTVLNHQFQILMIESSERICLSDENRYIIDGDLCEIHK